MRFLISRWLLRPVMLAVVAAAVLLVASGSTYRIVVGKLQEAMSVRIMLEPTLSVFPMTVGPWEGKDVPLRAGMLRVAENDDYINRRYVNGNTGELVCLYVAYTARPRTMLGHRPRVCYPSAGWLHKGTSEAELEAYGVRIPCWVHVFERPGLGGEQQLVLNYYVVNGEPTLDESSFSSVRWRDPNLRRTAERYASQVQVIVWSVLDAEAAERSAKRFAAASAQGLLALLPRPSTPRPKQAMKDSSAHPS